MIINFTQLAIILFLLINLIVAIRSSIPNPTMDEYVKANKNLPSGALIATLIATLLDAGNVGLKIGFQRGLISLSYPFSLLCSILSDCLLSFYDLWSIQTFLCHS